MSKIGTLLSVTFFSSLSQGAIEPYVASYPDAPHLALELAPTATHGTLISWADWTPRQIIALLYHIQDIHSLSAITIGARACNAQDCVPLRPQGVHAYEDLHTLASDYRVTGFLSGAMPSSWGENFLTQNTHFAKGSKTSPLNLQDIWERDGFFLSLRTQGDHLMLCPATWSVYDMAPMFQDITKDPLMKDYTTHITPAGAMQCLNFPKEVKKTTIEEILEKIHFKHAASSPSEDPKKKPSAHEKMKAPQKKPSAR